MKSILAYVSEYDISAALGLSFLAPKREGFHDESQDSSYNTYAVQQESALKIIKV